MLFAVTKGKNKRDIATILGIDLSNLNKLLRRYKLDLKGKRYDRSK
jgi:transposase